MSRPARRHLLGLLPITGGLLAGVWAAIAASRMTIEQLEDWTRIAGLAQVPKTSVLMLAAGCAVGLVVWAALYLIFGAGGPFQGLAVDHTAVDQIAALSEPASHWHSADTGLARQPDRDLPVDLNQPLAAFDPYAIPVMPLESVRRSGLALGRINHS